MNDADPCADLIDRLAEEFLTRYRRGERPAVQEYTDKYPEYAAQIRDLFPALVVMEQAAPASDLESANPVTGPPSEISAAVPEQLGDYRIVREIGRGGMGIVYEAEQQALGRRVALKVLHRPAAQDSKVLARFRRESRTAAQLHHSNIVPVFDVGQHDGLCYYAMQFIRGQALDEVFRELQRLRAGSVPAAAGEEAAPAGLLAQSLWTGEFEPAAGSGTVDHAPRAAFTFPGSETTPGGTSVATLPDHSELLSVTSNYHRYCRNVARLGLQAAHALAYAHTHGIVHRDIKPANLLLDTTGVLWVSDFGLVKTQDPALTDTGDLVGTLRYMAPERFRGECDTRADVYALGLTLYELLVLRPGFEGKDRLHLVEQIGRQEPARLRVLEPRIPRDLETILMKAIEKDSKRRYPSADAMAEDLRRYLADEPIKARRIRPLERLGRWGRRNPLVAGLSAAVVLITAIGFAGVFGQMQVAQANERQAERKEQEANKERDEAQRQRDEVRALNGRLQRTLYSAHMNLARHAWEAGATDQVVELLEQHRPKPGETDLRHFEWYYLWRLCHADLLTLKGHTGRVLSVAYSLDGKRLASAADDSTVKVWDAQTGHELFSFKIGPLHGVAFSPDGKRLASNPRDGTVEVWDIQTGQEILTFKGHTSYVTGVAFSPDSKRLASGDRDGVVKVWDAQTGQVLLTCKGHTSGVYGMAFSPDGKRLASGSYDGMGRVWDAQTGQELLTIKGPSSSLAFSPDGKRLTSLDWWDGRIKVWDAQTGQELFSQEGAGMVQSVAFSPDGKRLASCAGSQGIGRWEAKVWDAQTGQQLWVLQGHTGPVNSVAFSPDGKRLASASADGTVKIWDATTNPEARTFGRPTGGSHGVAYSLDGKRLAGWGGGAVKVWDAQTGQELLSLKSGGRFMAFSPDGKRLASSGSGVKVWDAQTGHELLTLEEGGRLQSVVFSPDSKRLASATGKEVKIWDVQTGQELLSLKGLTGRVSVAFSADGKRLASGTLDRMVRVWDAQTGQELLTLQGHTDWVFSVAFSPDGKRLASGGSEGGLKVWDAQTGQPLLALKGLIGRVYSVAFSPDGKRLASVSEGGTVKVWDTQTGQELLSLQGHRLPWDGVAFSRDGYHLAGIGPDGSPKIWDATPLPEKPSAKQDLR